MLKSKLSEEDILEDLNIISIYTLILKNRFYKDILGPI